MVALVSSALLLCLAALRIATLADPVHQTGTLFATYVVFAFAGVYGAIRLWNAGRLAGAFIGRFHGVVYTDMSPFRAISRELLDRLPMTELTYGWNLEMQILVARAGARIIEIPVAHRRRIGGVSEVSGTFWGTVRAATRILWLLARVAITHRRPRAFSAASAHNVRGDS